jgi:hypothetical protein
MSQKCPASLSKRINIQKSSGTVYVYPKRHKKVKIVFWPDLASAFSKEENRPNVLQLNQIENFWANLKSNNYRSKNVKKQRSDKS